MQAGLFCDRHKAATVVERETEQRFHIIPFWRGSCFPLRHFLCAIKILKYAAADKRSRAHWNAASLDTCALPDADSGLLLKDEHEGVGIYTELICLQFTAPFFVKNVSWAMTLVQISNAGISLRIGIHKAPTKKKTASTQQLEFTLPCQWLRPRLFSVRTKH